MTLADAAGRAHAPAAPGFRIVSLVPSITELLFDLGLGDAVVGRTAFCVHPRDRVRQVTSVGGTKTVNREKLRPLGASHVIVNVDETPRALAEELAAEGLEVVVTHPIEVRDNLDLYRLLGGLFGRADAAEDLCRRLEAALAGVEGRDWPRRRAAYLIWKDPWMTVSRDTYISRMLALVGIDTGDWPGGGRYPPVDLEGPEFADRDLVLFATEPFPFKERHAAAFAGARGRLIDGEMVSWYGSRAILGLGYLRDFAAALA
ncbi:MAG: ABC transporter substrate-binding protein [Hyphomicrobiales bacterium]|nr:ABC transporter substrate-binding protein [Hyphomicrobiales bacterium]MCP5372557.1 ABC transporter substrate-binding protein [Hyphomicrobiales bacterium]